MSNAIFPKLPGLEWSSTRAPIWNTGVQTAGSGKELRWTNWSYPVWEWTLSYEFLRAGGYLLEYEQLIGFFNARQGQFDTFLYSDPDDYIIAGHSQGFGIGDGATTSWQLVRTLGGFTEPVKALNGTPVIYKANVLQTTGYSVSATGVVTFTDPPATGALLTWGGSYYWRCRFSDDTATPEQFQKAFWLLKQIKLRSVK